MSWTGRILKASFLAASTAWTFGCAGTATTVTDDASGDAADESSTVTFDPPPFPDASSLAEAGDPGADAGTPSTDASADPDALVADAGVDGACTSPLGPGDLTIDELMIESVTGAGDYGEWLEVRSTRSCAIDLRGLHGETPRGARVVTFDVIDDIWLPPKGSFVVADSSDPVINHYLPGTIVAWAGQHGDVLRNKGSTITLLMSGVVIDALTYPALALTPGASLAFPADCPDALRPDWSRWQVSASSWFTGFLGTPSAPNADVHCPQTP